MPRRLPGAAHARIDQADAIAQGSGPALAGAVVSLLGAPSAVLVDAAGHLTSAVLVAGTRLPEPAAAGARGEPGRQRDAARRGPRRAVRGVGRDVGEGVRWVHRHSTLMPFAVSTHVWFACSALAVRLGRLWGAGRVIIATQTGTGLAWAVFAAGQLLLGLCTGASNANEVSHRQAVTPDRLQGRMNTTMRSSDRAAIVVAAPLGGLLGDAAGYAVALVVAAGGVVVTAAVAVATPLRGARLDDRHAVTDTT